MHILIPVWFHGFDSIMYFISSIIGFILSFYFYKIYSISNEKRHLYLYLGFLFLSMGLLILSITNLFSYIALSNCRNSCLLGITDNVFSFEDFSYLTYFGLSLFAYVMFLFAYRIKEFKFSKFFIIGFLAYLIVISILLPFNEEPRVWHSYHEYFHLVSLIMMGFLSFRNIINYIEKKSLGSLLVMVAFFFIFLFHLFHIFSFISGWMYILAHISMMTGFSALLLMVLRVKK